MYQYTRGILPKVFDTFFSASNSRHNYSTRLASRSTFSLPVVRTNYGKFNIRFDGPKVWNDIEESIKALNSPGISCPGNLRYPQHLKPVKFYL